MPHSLDMKSIRTQMDLDESTREIRGFVVTVTCSCGVQLSACGSKLSEAVSEIEDAILTHLSGYGARQPEANPPADRSAPPFQPPDLPGDQASGHVESM